MNKNDEGGNVEDGDDITTTITINMNRNIISIGIEITAAATRLSAYP